MRSTLSVFPDISLWEIEGFENKKPAPFRSGWRVSPPGTLSGLYRIFLDFAGIDFSIVSQYVVVNDHLGASFEAIPKVCPAKLLELLLERSQLPLLRCPGFRHNK